MRILRSQYIQLQNNVNATTTFGNVSPYKQQVTPRPSPYSTSKKSYDLRRKSEGTNAYHKHAINNGQGNNNDCPNIAVHQTVLRRSSMITKKTLVGRRASTRASAHAYGIERRDSYSSTCSTTYSSGYETLNQANDMTQDDHATMEKATQHQQTLDRSQPMETTSRQQQTLDQSQPMETTSCEQYHHMHIKFSNIDDSVGDISVSVQFTEMSAQWLTNVYRSYENDLWEKVPRLPPTRSSKWYYTCTLCHKRLCQFMTLKSHLNNHLELYPYVCKVCAKPYTGRKALVYHLQTKHGVHKEYNNYICT